MDKITVEGYRCFRERQSARLAPLTLLVGNNSTGKTSFLALIRALWEVAFLSESPDFQKDPYDLGTFRDIAHNRGGRGGRVRAFEAGFEYSPHAQRRRSKRKSEESLSFSARFEEVRAVPFPIKRCITQGNANLEVHLHERGQYHFRYSTPKTEGEHLFEYRFRSQDEVHLLPFDAIRFWRVEDEESIEIEASERKQIEELADSLNPVWVTPDSTIFPFASAPVRSRPRRTYDPVRPSSDPEGEYIPTYLANTSRRSPSEWNRLKTNLEEFGQSSGLFDEINIKSLGRSEGEPFQVQIRKSGSRRLKGPYKNLIDMGYGVSQALPVITELMRRDSPQIFLLQQPEVHLHPSAQAALGSLFCNIVAEGRRQLVVETHSDHLLDRVRMDVRDEKTRLKPEDVSILFFEEGELDVHIHSIRLDENGNVLDAPPSYRRFFMEETRRSIGL
ncbi:MAG: AAA family ATPase [Chloroflexi bacterium]|nr:AAA family ATPase [Chloroflexota bacterium]